MRTDFSRCGFFPLLLQFWSGLQCKFVTQNNLLLSPPICCQKVAVFVIVVPSIQDGFVPTMPGSASFLEQVLGFVVHSLSLGRSMFGTTEKVLSDDITWNARSSSCPIFWCFSKVLDISHMNNTQCRSISKCKSNFGIVSWKRFRKTRRSRYCPCR